jgi:transposase
MRKKLPPMHESAEALHQRMKSEHDGKKRQRLHALYLVASGQVRHRKDVASLLGVHRHSVAAWFDAYAAGGIEQALHYQGATPPVHRRITDTALRALQAKLNEPHGFAGYDQSRVWLAQEHQVALSYSSVHALVRYKLKAKPKRPRPSHGKKIPRP